ncbi:UDP-4-amino-4,6-dideoxy-N-acetyl-beta-L-altrosamine transaminase [Idiomarina abyssalis]|uniref:UDP-4-amino-4, 6-dideoxy-N-acetyl-beta-L-altrosamine transaminase n=1 Tax=Idiomarina abyssalis TaxID=86102 RepID=UPI003A8CF399
MIPYGRQDINEQDLQAVMEVLKSDFLTQGPKVPEFETQVAQKVGAKHALAVNSATSALHIACLALGLGEGDWLWTTPITFVASANCGRYCGAQVDFVDIDPITFNLSPKALAEKLTIAEAEGRLPKVVVVVHLCGQSCEMRDVHALSERYGFKVIEDASHAVGGKYLGEYIGNCRYSDITVFSFHPVKIITTAEGGMAVTNDDALAEKMHLFRSHGVTREPHLMTHEPDGPWYYQQVALGFNYRMTELQAALGSSQLTRLDRYVEQRNQLAQRYDEQLSSNGLIQTPSQQPGIVSARHLYVIRLELDEIKTSRKEVFEGLRRAGIGVNVHYIPVHTQPYYQDQGFKWGQYPNAERYYQEAISLPLYPQLTHDEQDFIVEQLRAQVTKHQG